MYNLLVSNQFMEWDGSGFRFEKGRFLEYTSDAIKAQIRSLSSEAIECIQSWPCILMQEGRAEEPVHIAKILELRDLGREIGLSVKLFPGRAGILNGQLWRIREDLDIEQFEFSRNHWAIKERDLLALLSSSGIEIDESAVRHFESKPLPAPNRAALITARNKISEWSHTKIDDLLLEAGVEDLAADRDLGSRRDRANAIVEFAFQNPSAVTAENSMFSVFLLKQAFPEEAKVDGPVPKPMNHDAATTRELPFQADPTDRSPNRVFVVHGQNDMARSAVVTFLESAGLVGIVLHEQPNMGRHLLTKFIQEAELVTFAVVLMTDDDIGSLKGGTSKPRARQNVILELGYFLSHLGQARVCALITPGLETPSDFDGIVYIRMDEAGAWKQELKRELIAAGMPVT